MLLVCYQHFTRSTRVVFLSWSARCSSRSRLSSRTFCPWHFMLTNAKSCELGYAWIPGIGELCLYFYYAKTLVENTAKRESLERNPKWVNFQACFCVRLHCNSCSLYPVLTSGKRGQICELFLLMFVRSFEGSGLFCTINSPSLWSVHKILLFESSLLSQSVRCISGSVVYVIVYSSLVYM